jgi:hypothetical protein
MPVPAEAPVLTEEPLANDASALPGTAESAHPALTQKTVEIGGPPGPEPTRYGDWEKSGRCIDF